LFLIFGGLLERAGDAVARGTVLGDDDHARRQQRRLAVLLQRLGRLAPGMFAALERENALLGAVLHEAAAELGAHGVVAPAPVGHDDPLELHRTLLAALDETVLVLHAHGDDVWGPPALSRLRRGLADVAAVEEALIHTAFDEPAA
jgi:hypothetical protein